MDPVPGVFEGGANVVAVLVLLAEFAMLRAQLLRTQVRLYAWQSLFVAVLAVLVGAEEGIPELYVLAALSVGLKVVIVPLVVLRLMRDADTDIAGSGRFGVASAVLLAIGVAAFGLFVLNSLHFAKSALPTTALCLAGAVVLVAFVLMIVRSDVVSQAIGFYSLGNGVSLASLVVAARLPLIVEVVFLFDLLVAVVVFGVLMKVHHARTASLSTQTLTRLRG